MSVRPYRFAFAVFAAVLTLAVVPGAQAQDCTGISDVSDFDGPTISDFDGKLHTVRVASGLTRPLLVTAPPGDLDRLYIVEQNGEIKILENGSVLPIPFADLGAFTRAPGAGGNNEEGLLNLVFHPDYATNQFVFVYYTNTTGSQNLVVRYKALSPYVLDVASGKQVIAFPHPTFGNHNGGSLAFGPDGYLYIGVGDGGSACDPFNTGQDLSDLRGKLLRLDIDLGAGSLPPDCGGSGVYSIPTDNPFADGVGGNCDEVWAYGLRNPWRTSFDSETNALYIGDVGQNAREEINCRPPGGPGGENYGWDRYEGSVCPNPSCGSQGSCSIGVHTGPIVQYSGTPRSITGGSVYRGCRMGDLRGTYFYADYVTSDIQSFRTGAACGVSTQIDRNVDLAPGGGLSITSITSFGTDGRGELYLTDRNGEVFKVVPTLSIMEVSGANADAFRPDGGDWSWEDLGATSSHPISTYKVYRADGSPTATFSCVHQGSSTTWAGGDPDTPAADQAYYYVVTARNTSGEESRPGAYSDGTPRVVDTASACP